MKQAETWVIASHNPGKIKEIADLLQPFGVAVRAASELGLAEPEETETSFAGNAALKARAACAGSGLPSLADDSGLEVAALDGAPGVVSARWAGPDGDFTAAMARVRRDMLASGSPDASARFVCALALARPDGRCDIYEGEVRGDIVWPPRGTRGFGYDAIFRARGMSETFAEIEPVRKHKISHRAAAFARLVAAEFGA